MIIDKSIKRVTVGNTEMQKNMSGGVFYGKEKFLHGEYIN